MNINDKIKQILVDKNLTPSYFADEIGVQRSSISHILSGRNRPSFDIIQKIIRRFPELGYEWIMEEDAHQSQVAQLSYGVPRNNAQPPAIGQRDRLVSPSSAVTAFSLGNRNQRNELPPNVQQLPTELPVRADSTPVASLDKKVERILIFYTDGSFREYAPAQ